MKTSLKTIAAPTLHEAAATIGMSPFPEQASVSARLFETATRGTIGFIEAPTATGKTLAICHHAMAMSLDEGRPTVIAVPTVATGHQTMAAIDSLRSASKAFEWLRTRMIVGRQDFLSPEGIQDLLPILDPETAAVIAGWIKDGAPGRSASHAEWTMDGLESRLDAEGIGGMDLSGRSGLTLGPSDKEGPSQRSYERQFSADADVIVVTHAMLGRDLLARYVATSKERKRLGMKPDASLPPAEQWLAANRQRLEIETGGEGRLPDHRRLIVDEAHMLRESIESAMSSTISICALVRHCEALARSSLGLLSAKTLREVRNVRRDLIAMDAEAGSSIRMSWSNDDPLQRIVLRLHEALTGVKTGKATADLELDAIAVDRAKYALAESVRAKDAVSTVFDWSPVRSFPAITIGRRHLRSELDFLWNRLESAALVSATLYTDNVGGPSIGYMSNRLHVPERRIAAFPPIAAPWIRKPVSAFIPSRDAASALEPGDEEARLNEIARRIAAIAAGGSRGTLVLSTSRSDSAALSLRLAAIIGEDRIVDGTRDRLIRLRTVHVAKSRLGLRPVWLAQGPAWTGLDLPDDVIDSLVITRLPFPKHDASRSGEKAHYGVDKIARMGMTTKQGVGRLVRTRNASPKTLHFLDGRIRIVASAGIALSLARSYDPAEFD